MVVCVTAICEVEGSGGAPSGALVYVTVSQRYFQSGGSHQRDRVSLPNTHKRTRTQRKEDADGLSLLTSFFSIFC